MKEYTEWNLHDILTSLIEAWETIPREFIIFSFQRTRFRTDDCFLQINCDCWDNLKMGISFKKFVIFDDNLLDEEISHEKNNYNLRNRKNIIEINKNNSSSILKITKNDENTMIQKLSNKIIKKYQSMPSEVRNYTDQKNCPVMTNHEKEWNDHIKSKKLKKNLIDMNIKQRKSRKRTYDEAQFVKKERNRNRYAIRQENIKNNFVPKDSNIASSMLRRKKFQKEITQRQKPEVNEIQESHQKVIDKALTLLSTKKVNYLNLIDSINNNTDEETIKSNNNLSQFQFLNNKQNNTESECANKIITNFSNNFLNNFNQPSTSTNNWNLLSQEIAEEIASNEIINNKKQVFEISFVNASESQKENHDKSQNLNLPINNSALKIMNFSTKKQQNSLDLNNPVDSETDEPRTKKSRTDYNWYKQFETTFVFGSPNINYPGMQRNKKDIIESCIFSIKPSVSPKD